MRPRAAVAGFLKFLLLTGPLAAKMCGAALESSVGDGEGFINSCVFKRAGRAEPSVRSRGRGDSF
jgi:hypothetical protein